MVRHQARGSASALAIAFCVLVGCDSAGERSLPAGRAIEIEADTRISGSPILLGKLADGTPDERLRAARAMGRIQSPSYLEGLGRALSDDTHEVRLAALFAIGQLGLVADQPVEPRATELVRPLLDDDEFKIVAAALEALGKLAATDAPEAIAPLLSHSEPLVRTEAAFALFRCRFAPLWRREVTDPPELPAVAVSALVAAMKDPEPDVRFAATYTFSRYGDTRARTALVAATTDRTARVRLFAVRGLGHVADPDSLPALISRLRDENAGVRVEAVGALRRAASFEAIERVVEDPIFHVRSAVATAFGEASSSSSLEHLRALAGDASVSVRVAAIEALVSRLGPAALDRIPEWSASPDWRVRVAAARSIGKTGEAGSRMATQLFEDRDPRVRAAVLAGLAGAPFGDPIVVAGIGSDDLAVRGEAVARLAERESLDRLSLFATALADSPGELWVEVRESIVDALAAIDGSDPILRRTLAHDPAPSVRGKAAAALGETLATDGGAAFTPSPWLDTEPQRGIHVDLDTAHGTMRIELFADEAPAHVASFLARVDAGFYEGLIWHRVVSNFVIQGGDPRGDGWGSDGTSLRDEINTVRYDRGMLGMPKAGKDTGGCQLFITHVPTPHLDGNYTIFGRVVSGSDVIDAIEVGDSILRIRRSRSK